MWHAAFKPQAGIGTGTQLNAIKLSRIFAFSQAFFEFFPWFGHQFILFHVPFEGARFDANWSGDAAS
jgi:hypothetical protein